jgi:hypothetical protein
MLRAKAIKFKSGGVGLGERFLASTDVHGQFAGIPVVVQIANAVNRTKPARKLLDGALGVHPDAWMPELAPQRFRWSADRHGEATVVTNGERTPGKVAIFATCYVNYNEPGIGHDLLKLLNHFEVPYRLVGKEVCCGMPKLELGDLDSVESFKNLNMPALAPLARDGSNDARKRRPAYGGSHASFATPSAFSIIPRNGGDRFAALTAFTTTGIVASLPTASVDVRIRSRSVNSPFLCLTAFARNMTCGKSTFHGCGGTYGHFVM